MKGGMPVVALLFVAGCGSARARQADSSDAPPPPPHAAVIAPPPPPGGVVL